MKIETRVEKLEQELKVLKTEIQATLLEIQEQILNRYYPTLRAEEETTAPSTSGSPRGQEGSALSNGLPNQGAAQRTYERVKLEPAPDGDEPSIYPTQHAGGAAARGMAMPAVSPFKDILVDLVEDDPVDDMLAIPAGAPQTRQVSLVEARRPHLPPQGVAAVAPTPQPSFAQLAGWVADGVRSLGKARTLKAVETYAAGRPLAAETKTLLTQLIEWAEDEGPSEPAGPNSAIELMVKLDQLVQGS